MDYIFEIIGPLLQGTAVTLQVFEEVGPRLIVNEAVGIERQDLRIGQFGGPAENRAQVGIGGQRRAVVWTDKADVHAFAQAVEQIGKRFVRQP